MKVAESVPPLGAAVVLAAAMLWLAGGPSDEPLAEGGGTVRPLELREPAGELPSFPRRFAWEAVPGATSYEITVGPEGSRTPLFRQRGPAPGLDLTFEPGHQPPPGRYEWNVLALRGEHPIALGVGKFLVAPGTPRPSSP